MANEVYANGMEVSCKAAAGKAICAFPDTCFTPPLTPATPPGVPVPYPNTGMASDATSGSTSVKISNQEVMLKNKSYFKRSMGDEAGCAPKKGVVTSVNMGKVYFTAWSMDVKVEGENVVRNLDLTTHNHASMPGNSPTWPYLDAAAFGGAGECKEVAEKVKNECVGTDEQPKNLLVFDKTKEKKVKRKESMDKLCAEPKCAEALACVVSPYSPNNCCPPGDSQPTPHHIVPKSQFKEIGKTGQDLTGGRYDANKAPCICLEGNSHSVGKHGEVHAKTNTKTRALNGTPPSTQIDPTKRWDLGQAESTGAEAVSEVTNCPKGCIEEQIRKGHEEQKMNKEDKVRPTTAGGEDDEEDEIVGIMG